MRESAAVAKKDSPITMAGRQADRQVGRQAE